MKKRSLSFFPVFCSSVIALTGVVFAQPGNGIRIGEQTLLVPDLALSYNYNSNINLRERALDESSEPLDQPESDTYYSYTAALKMTRVTGSRRMHISGWYGQDAYQDYTDLDGKNYGVAGGIIWTRPGKSTIIEATGKYEYAIDRAGSENLDLGTNQEGYIENAADRVERYISSAGLKINQDLINDFGGAFIFGYDENEYVQKDYNDRSSYDYILELNYRYSDKTEPYARLGYGIDQDDGFDGNATKPFILGGVRYTATDKLRFDAGVGYETYTRTPKGSEEQESDGLKYTLRVHYKATAKTTFRLAGHNGYDSVSYQGSSSRKENVISLLGRHQTSRKINQSLSVSWREDEYLEPIESQGQSYDELKKTIRYQYVFNYQTVRPWLILFAKASFEDGESNIPNDSYEQTEVGVGLSMRY